MLLPSKYDPFKKVAEMIEYNGFYIDSIFRIFKDGRQVFCAHWQRCADLDQAKRLIDYSNAANEKLRKRPDLDRVGEFREELENGQQASEDFSNWSSDQHEKQLNHDEYRNY